MANLNIKSGDKVVVIAGKDKGKVSTVVASFPKAGKVTVKDVNVVTKHNKPKSAQDKGGIAKVEAKIDVSNVQLVCPACGKATRVAHKEVEGKNVRTCKKCQAVIDGGKKAAKKTTAKEEVKAEKPATTEKAPAKTTKTTTKTTATKSTSKTTAAKKTTKPAAEDK